MKKILSKILIAFFVIGVFLMPASGFLNLQIQKNTAGAQSPADPWWWEGIFSDGTHKVFGSFATLALCQADITGNVSWKALGPCFQSATTPNTTTGGSFGNNGNGLNPNALDMAAVQKAADNQADDNWGCGYEPWTWFQGCIAKLIYYVIWVPVASVARIAARILDFFIAYSLRSTSYDNGFVDKAWGTVRDIANIFFIISLLYIAIKIVIDHKVAESKRLIGTIIVVALIINFSLFTTKVIIDASNIIAKIFYNQITPIDETGALLPPGSEKERSVTVGLVNTFNAQAFQDLRPQTGAVITVMVIEIAIMLYMIFMFLSVALLFVGRVVALWIAMIFSPLAFASYSLPDVNIPGFGHKLWWSELFKNAFMAPIFIFFLYIIILFGSFLQEISYGDPNSTQWIDRIMPIIIPFAIIFVLLMKAKKLAVESSGELGQAITSGGKILGGLALGAATGGAALVGTNVLGGGASRIMDKFGERWKSSGYTTDEEGNVVAKKGVGAYLSRMALKGTDYTTKAHFDARQTKFGSTMGGVTGMNFQSPAIVGLGSQKGGFVGAANRRAEKQEKEKELFKTSMSDDQVKAWSYQREVDYENNAKKSLNADEYRRTHAAPKVYTTADQLNADRMRAYKDNLGTNDLLGALSFSLSDIVNNKNYKSDSAYVKLHRQRAEEKERVRLKGDFDQEKFDEEYTFGYDYSIAKEVNDNRINTKKMIIGGTAAVTVGAALGGSSLLTPGITAGTGFLTGGAGVSATTLGVTGGVLGAGYAAGKGRMQDISDAKVGGAIAKDLKRSEDTIVRVANAKNRLSGYSDTVKGAIDSMDERIENRIASTIESKERTTKTKLTDEEKKKIREEITDKFSYIDVKRKGDEKTGEVEKDANGNAILQGVNKEKLATIVAANSTEMEDLRNQLRNLDKTLKDKGNTAGLENRRRELMQMMSTGDPRFTKKESDELADIGKRIEAAQTTSSGDSIQAEIDKVKDKMNKIKLEESRIKDMGGIQEKIASARDEISRLTGEKSSGGTPAGGK